MNTQEKGLSLLALANVEALASGEDNTVSGNVTCTGDGTLYCYLNKKTEYKVIRISQ